ncbi:hypothetical protein ACHAPU_001269 [Fusarium lateritium]
MILFHTFDTGPRHIATSYLNIDTHLVQHSMPILTCIRGSFASGLCGMIANTIACIRSKDSTEADQPNTPTHTINVSDASQAAEPAQFDQSANEFESSDLQEAVSLSGSSSWVTIDSESMTLSTRIHEWMDDVTPGSPDMLPKKSPGKVAIKKKKIQKVQKWIRVNPSTKQVNE